MEVKIEKSLEKFRLDVEFVSESRRIGILGASGSGKSLLLRSLAGVESVDKMCIRDRCYFLFPDKGRRQSSWASFSL